MATATNGGKTEFVNEGRRAEEEESRKDRFNGNRLPSIQPKLPLTTDPLPEFGSQTNLRGLRREGGKSFQLLRFLQSRSRSHSRSRSGQANRDSGITSPATRPDNKRVLFPPRRRVSALRRATWGSLLPLSLFRPFVEQMMRTAATTAAMMNMRYDIPSPMHMFAKEKEEIGLGRMWRSVAQVSSRGRSASAPSSLPSRLLGQTANLLFRSTWRETRGHPSIRHPHVVRAQDRGHVRASGQGETSDPE